MIGESYWGASALSSPKFKKKRFKPRPDVNDVSAYLGNFDAPHTSVRRQRIGERKAEHAPVKPEEFRGIVPRIVSRANKITKFP